MRSGEPDSQDTQDKENALRNVVGKVSPADTPRQNLQLRRRLQAVCTACATSVTCFWSVGFLPRSQLASYT
jgi:hypothetical protein